MSKKDGFLGRRLTLKSNALFRFAPLVNSVIGGGGPSGSWIPWSDAKVFSNLLSFHDKAVLLMGLGIDLR